jgi:hypothetical protein
MWTAPGPHPAAHAPLFPDFLRLSPLFSVVSACWCFRQARCVALLSCTGTRSPCRLRLCASGRKHGCRLDVRSLDDWYNVWKHDTVRGCRDGQRRERVVFRESNSRVHDLAVPLSRILRITLQSLGVRDSFCVETCPSGACVQQQPGQVGIGDLVQGGFATGNTKYRSQHVTGERKYT